MPDLFIEFYSCAMMLPYRSHRFWSIKEREDAADESQPFAQMRTRREWTVYRPQGDTSRRGVTLRKVLPAHYQHARNILLRDDRIQKCLIIFAIHIRLRQILLDKRGLAHKRFKHGRCRFKGDPVCFRHHVYDARAARRDKVIVKIASHTVAKRCRLAYI